jgi:hypothetical protein
MSIIGLPEKETLDGEYWSSIEALWIAYWSVREGSSLENQYLSPRSELPYLDDQYQQSREGRSLPGLVRPIQIPQTIL